MSGLKLAVSYGIFPHKLGFCGPKEKTATKILLDYLAGKKTFESRVKKILRDFKGAYPYYKLIAKSNKIKNPFSEKVVKAYWVGNFLLNNVKITELKKLIIHDFSAPGLLKREDAKKKAERIPLNSKPHHSFHVLFVGSVSGSIKLKGNLLDLCRIGWGQIRKIKRNKAVVYYYPISNKKPYLIKRPVEKYFFWNKKFIPRARKGDWVTVHWNNLVQVINKKDLDGLKKYTFNTLNSLNG